MRLRENYVTRVGHGMMDKFDSVRERVWEDAEHAVWSEVWHQPQGKIWGEVKQQVWNRVLTVVNISNVEGECVTRCDHEQIL